MALESLISPAKQASDVCFAVDRNVTWLRDHPRHVRVVYEIQHRLAQHRSKPRDTGGKSGEVQALSHNVKEEWYTSQVGTSLKWHAFLPESANERGCHVDISERANETYQGLPYKRRLLKDQINVVMTKMEP